MSGDLYVLGGWWLVLGFFGLAGWPLVSLLFPKWEDKGYLLSKAGGIMATTYVVWILGSLRIMSFGVAAIVMSGLTIAIAGIIVRRLVIKERLKINWKLILVEELLFLLALTSWSWVKAHEPTINGLEKFMDYGFTQSILRSEYFPPQDMWFSGEPINYYYFGHLAMAIITKLSGVGLENGFNLMLATLFAFCLTMSLTIGRELLEKTPKKTKFIGTILIALLVTLAGNLHTIYAFTSGYWGSEENPPPFWQILQPVWNKEKLLEGINNYWYPNATRFIPFTIHEFPAYSFVVSDIHGHVLSIPIVLFLLALLVQFFGKQEQVETWQAGAYGLVAGMAFMTNALDGPIYLGLFALLLLVLKFHISNFKKPILLIVIAGIVFIVSALPFLVNFKPFVNGIAVNCPPAALANRKIGPLIFEEVEKCQKSPIWMMLVLWGFFLYNGLGLWLLTDEKTEHKKMLLSWSVFSFLLIIFAEFFYFKDIYPQHFRSNTMFKLGYQAFIMMSIVSGYTITKLIQKPKKLATIIFLMVLAPLLLLISIYPYFGVRSYFNGLKEYRGLYGLNWMLEKYPDDFAAVGWLNKYVSGQPVVLEAAGDSYTDYERISAFTGLPTVAGWAVHEWLWRGSYEPIAARATDAATIYESDDESMTRYLIGKYKIKYIVIGDMERKKYLSLNEEKIAQLAEPVFSQNTIKIYKVLN